ncbi:MAG: cytochrome c oxidase subunit II [Planctomycetales bacterium]|nr:cytochrome c oxidase subunit II [Planctomycetales bacterium]
MNESFRLFPEAASHGAWEVDYLTFALLGITTLFSVGISLAIVFFVGRYWHTREVNRVSSHSNLLHWVIELTWSIGPLIILMFMFAWGAAVFLRAHQPPNDSIDVYVVAKQWMWKVGHQNGRREINELHVPLGTPVRLTMISEDVIHSMFVPAFRIKQDVIPGRYTTLWFEATKTGTYHLFCAEYCGTDHSRMRGHVVVQTPQEYARWLEAENVESMAQRGRRHIEAMGCLKCHGQTQASSATPTQIGPPLTGLYGSQVPLSDGELVLADDAYIRRALLDPRSQTRAGFAGVMPSYEGQLEPEQIMEITAYIRSIADATGPLAGPGTSLDLGEEQTP